MRRLRFASHKLVGEAAGRFNTAPKAITISKPTSPTF